MTKEQVCSYCDFSKNKYGLSMDGGYGARLVKYDNGFCDLITVSCGDDKTIVDYINFCPKCGRRLNVKHE